MNKESIILGSGILYLHEFTGEIPTNEIIETEENRAGHIKGGATLEYSTESQTEQDDLGCVKETIITKEDVKFKTGLITWKENYLKGVFPTMQLIESDKYTTIKIGGITNSHSKQYLWRFVHTKKNAEKVRITVTGQNQSTISITFKNDEATTVNAEVMAEPLDDSGVLIIFETEKQAPAPIKMVAK